MILEQREQDLQHLRMLCCQRERRASDAVVEQKSEVQRVEGRLLEQTTLIAGLREQIRLLHQLRSPESTESLSAESLLMESTRRRWLTYDLEQEVFYLSGFESDVSDARSELRSRQRTQSKARARISSLDELMNQNHKQQDQIEARREDARQDDRPQRKCVHG